MSFAQSSFPRPVVKHVYLCDIGVKPMHNRPKTNKVSGQQVPWHRIRFNIRGVDPGSPLQ